MQGRLGGRTRAFVLSLPSVGALKRRPDGILSGNIRGMTSHKVSIGMEIGKESLLRSECSRWDYVDRYRFAVADPGDRIGLSDLAEAFVGPGPRWVEGLFALRNRIVSVFGFKTPAAQGKNAAGHGGKWESGERVGIFEVLARSTDEIVLGDNELESGRAELKNMKTGEKRKIAINGEDFINDYVTVSTEAEDFSQDGIFF